jgi:CRP/FNR family transcriptional regulator, cyclic AMP receptor protein
LNIPERLHRWELFSHFTDEQIDQLAGHLSALSPAAGSEVFAYDDPSRGAYLVESGLVHIRRQTPYGLYTLARLGDGNLFGETSFVDALPRSGTAVLDKESDLLAFDLSSLEPVLQEDQRLYVALYWTFWKSLSRKLRRTNEKLTQFFSDAAHPEENEPAATRDPTGEFHLDLAAKRALFQEQKLSSMEINFLATLSKEVKARPGKVLFREGDVGNEMFVVLDGKVMISKYIPGAGEEALAFLERGDYFGEMALIDNQPRSADAKASKEGAVLLAIPREVVEGLLDMRKVSSQRLLTILCRLVAKRLRELNEKLITWYIFSGGSESKPT